MLCLFANESKFCIIYGCTVADSLRGNKGIRTDPTGFTVQVYIQHFCLIGQPSQAVALVGLTKISLCSDNTGPAIAGVFQLTNVLCSESWGWARAKRGLFPRSWIKPCSGWTFWHLLTTGLIPGLLESTEKLPLARARQGLAEWRLPVSQALLSACWPTGQRHLGTNVETKQSLPLAAHSVVSVHFFCEYTKNLCLQVLMPLFSEVPLNPF